MVNKFEAVGIGLSIAIMALALFMLRIDQRTVEVIEADESQPAIVVVSQEGDQEQALLEAMATSVDESGRIDRLIVDDVVTGTGEMVEAGDTVTVHYIGTLQNGQEFDNSRDNGTPFTFTVGEGRVIEGWDLGLVGMQVGGQRILVIPPEFGYGSSGVGPIPGNATLVFSIELLDIE